MKTEEERGMKRVVDQAVLWIYCLMAAILVTVDIPFVAAALGALLYACADCLMKPALHPVRIRRCLAWFLLGSALVCPKLFLFTPLVLYGILEERRYLMAVLLGAGSLFSFASNPEAVCFAGVGCLIAGLMQYQTREYILMEERYRRTRDDGVEKNLLLREKNQSILKNQDYEIYTATLRERNRIAREIHDNVGHMLSRAILMVGAMKTVHGEGNLKEPLGQLNETLNAAMTSVRESVHDLHDESINLREVLESLVKDFTFCRAQLAYDMGYDVPREIRYGFIAIVKEALHNVAKHSDAIWVRVTAREHPGLYQLIVEDNGSAAPDRLRSTNQGMADLEADRGWKAESDRGIGLCNMQDRVDAFGGHLEIRSDRGWRIYITVPKEERRIQ